MIAMIAIDSTLLSIRINDIENDKIFFIIIITIIVVKLFVDIICYSCNRIIYKVNNNNNK